MLAPWIIEILLSTLFLLLAGWTWDAARGDGRVEPGRGPTASPQGVGRGRYVDFAVGKSVVRKEFEHG